MNQDPLKFTITEFPVAPGGRKVDCVMAEPVKLAANPAVLMQLSTGRDEVEREGVYGITVRAFLAAGHRFVGFEMPHHGKRMGSWKKQELAGFCEAFVAGSDPFTTIVEDGRAVVDEIIARGWGEAGRIFICGPSRCGYGALRIMAADQRIQAAAVDAPVTDWRALAEFAGSKDRADVAGLALTHYAADLVDRPVWVGIGNCDNRVSTAYFLSFCHAIAVEQEKRKMDKSLFEAHVVEGPGHGFPAEWRQKGAEWLVRMAARQA